MYNPPQFRMQDLALARQLIDEHPLALLIGPDADGRSFASHLPLSWGEDAAGGWWLEGHMARANPQHAWLAAQPELLVVFSGPGGYVSPRHYDGALNVPTWNYLALHVRGRLELVDEALAKDRLLKRLIAQHEPGYAAQWMGLPEDFQHKLLGAIVGFRIHVQGWEAKAKLSQNRSVAERARLRESYTQQGHEGAQLLRWMDRLGL
ncbi:FMN-binding negative transcriptional regulator [Paucibacter soli]|uniref:FMN-binding negative transcriptional regulator n=1 Tax=Paucibacter soli TaxID=3133433 RepID=UPI00309DF497